jgi:hypothetical protein
MSAKRRVTERQLRVTALMAAGVKMAEGQREWGQSADCYTFRHIYKVMQAIKQNTQATGNLIIYN